jgi:hypothetical protein
LLSQPLAACRERGSVVAGAGRGDAAEVAEERGDGCRVAVVEEASVL